MAKNLEQRLANKPATGATPSLTQSIQRMEEQFALAMPKGAEAAQLVRDALTCVRQTPNLAQCDQATVLGGLMTCAQLGLRPGVLGQAWLIPFKNNRAGRYEAQLVIGYHGLVELAHRSGKIKSLIARTVYENDHFDVDYGLEDKLVHKPCLTGDKGKPIAYYAVARLTTGGHAFFVMSHDEMMAYKRQNAKSPNRGPWADNFEQMSHKTCVRQLAKWLPKSTDMATAIENDGATRIDLAPAALSYPRHEDTGGDDGAVDGEVIDNDGAPVVEPDGVNAPVEN
ncbi:recombination protein RecT [Corynebacterium macclintockiae]|uniref:recombination protein RecT n=1 Tax=Corynebacterium macclintockiae TaxID=2913501 RepID=UPI003EBFDBDA